MISRASRLLVGAAALAGCMFASQAFAQSNPFIPASQEQRADIERIIDAKVKEVEARITATLKTSASKAGPAAGTPGAPGAPVTPGAPGAPGVAGAGPLNPGGAAGGPSYPPVAGAAGAVAQPQMGAVEEARSSGTRFLGCINGTHKFMKSTGERVTFPAAQITRAVKDGSLPACR